MHKTMITVTGSTVRYQRAPDSAISHKGIVVNYRGPASELFSEVTSGGVVNDMLQSRSPHLGSGDMSGTRER